MPKVPIAEPVEAKVDRAEESKIEEIIKVPKILSPPTETKLSKAQKASATPKRRRMANVLDAVLETTKVLSPAATKKLLKLQKRRPKLKLGKQKPKLHKLKLKPKLGLKFPPRCSLLSLRKKRQSRLHLKRSKLLLPKLRTKALTTSFVMLREKNYPKKKC
jgi:hypothetical protein